ncbi:MAG: hypothetical protein IBJ05_11230 [Blastomonas sp.]|nr:hypothetical protein [Blastomonas sp.]
MLRFALKKRSGSSLSKLPAGQECLRIEDELVVSGRIEDIERGDAI